MKKIILILISLMMIMCGCSEIAEEESVQADVTVSTAQPYPVTIDTLTFNNSPAAVGSLSPAVTEMIFELGFGDRLVCKSSYCDYPAEASSIASTGSSANPDIDAIIAASPDLLITQSPIANKDLTRLSGGGISVLNLPAPSSIEELFENYEKLSLIFSGSIEGESLARAVYSKLETSLFEAKSTCSSLVYILNITENGFSVATGDSFAGDFISAFGENIAQNNTDYFMTSDEIISADPQVILLADPIKSSDIDSEISSQLSAFNNGLVYIIDGKRLERPTARLSVIASSISEIRQYVGSAEGFSEGSAVVESVVTAPSDQQYE